MASCDSVTHGVALCEVASSVSGTRLLTSVRSAAYIPPHGSVAGMLTLTQDSQIVQAEQLYKDDWLG